MGDIANFEGEIFHILGYADSGTHKSSLPVIQH